MKNEPISIPKKPAPDQVPQIPAFLLKAIKDKDPLLTIILPDALQHKDPIAYAAQRFKDLDQVRNDLRVCQTSKFTLPPLKPAYTGEVLVLLVNAASSKVKVIDFTKAALRFSSTQESLNFLQVLQDKRIKPLFSQAAQRQLLDVVINQVIPQKQIGQGFYDKYKKNPNSDEIDVMQQKLELKP